MPSAKKGLFRVTKKMCARVYPAVKPGDNIEISFTRKPVPGRLVLVSEFEKQWLEKYSVKLKRRNIYPVTKIIMTN